ncbi:hypothetical protein HID58_070893 [Brassica napus]|uniref:non-specific serine/threonine protein kinase n=2 Tax=Brassica napus TaxID=3708 RepID=A0ABQ7Z058_BRANA|nr:hypothetical protein HID58_070893 [Brassica napus]
MMKIIIFSLSIYNNKLSNMCKHILNSYLYNCIRTKLYLSLRRDLSFNKLTGEVEAVKAPKNTYLTGNMLSGNISSGVFLNNDESNIDLSYNNLSLPSSCQEKSHINTYRSSNWKDNLSGMLPCAGPIKCLGSPEDDVIGTAVSALYSQLKELQKKDADMKERDKMLYSKLSPSKYMKQFISQMQGDTDSTSKLIGYCMCVHAFIYLSYMNTVYLYRLVARDTDLPLAATLLKAYAKVEPLTIAELNYLLSLLHPRTLTSYVPGELLALTWTKGGVMMHAPNAVKLQHTVSAIAFVRCDNAHAVGTFRYRVEKTIADGTAEGAFFCFDGVVTKLHSLIASEAGQMLAEGVNPEDFKMPPFTTHIEAKTYTFQFSVSTYNFKAIRHSPSRSFSMNVTVSQSLTLSTTDDDGDDMPDGNPIPVKVETGGSSGEAAFNADTDPVDQKSLHINCGGGSVNIKNSLGKINYQADNIETTASTNQHSINWGVSNTGDFTDDGNDDDTYIISTDSTLPGEYSDLYKTARISALSLVYYAFCLENGTYNVNLHFMEIQFTEELYISLGRRIFDVYIQVKHHNILRKMFLRDFNIKEEANGTMKPIVQELKDVNVTNHVLEIRLYWAGKGTTLIPNRGYYGPLISAISLCHSQERRCGVEKTKHHTNYPMISGAIGGLVAILLLALGIYAARKRYIEDKSTKERAQGLQTNCFTWRQLQAATNNFDQANKLGEGGFGSVFKGELSNGTIIAVKQLSSESSQGNREFVNEIGMISGLNHPNLVKLYGCCVEKNQLLLVYEYMEKNSLALALFGKSSHKLNWSTRQKICVGIARGLEFLHHGSTIKMVHRDIKTTNVLLDTDFNAKISDFGLARLHDEEHSHISTKIAGTIGYMAPEYALRGQLTEKADVYSFGIVAMEIVSGRSTVKKKGSAADVPLINWALTLEKRGDIMEVIDPILEGDFQSEEARSCKCLREISK